MKLKQLVEEISHDICFGCYEDEAFNVGTISLIQRVSKEIADYVEKSPDTENEQWHVRYIAFTPPSFKQLVEIMGTGIQKGWYSLLWNEEHIYIIFSNGRVRLGNSGNAISPRVTSTNNAETLLQSNGLNKEYLDFWLDKAFTKFIQISKKL